MTESQWDNSMLANAVLQNLSVDDIILVFRCGNNIDAGPELKIRAFTLMLVGLKETCQIQLTDYTKT